MKLNKIVCTLCFAVCLVFISQTSIPIFFYLQTRIFILFISCFFSMSLLAREKDGIIAVVF